MKLPLELGMNVYYLTDKKNWVSKYKKINWFKECVIKKLNKYIDHTNLKKDSTLNSGD